MAAPLIEAGDITESGNNTASSSWAVSYPNASAGDLLIFNLGWDDSTTTSSVTAPAGPNGEVLSSIAGPVASASTEVRGQSWFTIATGTWTASTLTFTPSASEQWTAGVIKVPAGEFDPRDPMGAASTRASADTADTTVDSVGYAIGAADGGGTLVWFAVVDTVALGSLSSGWTSRVTRDRGAVAIGIATRDAATTASETTSSTDTWGISADSWASIAYVVRPPPTLYYVVYPSAASAPSAAQIKAGQQQSGAAATAAGSENARTTTGEEVFAAAATGLTGGTSYKTAFVWSDLANDGNVSTTAAWTTDTVAALTGSAATASAGTAGVTHTQAASGSAVTTSAGTLTALAEYSAALTGAAAAAGAGTVSPVNAAALSGSGVTASAGSVAPAQTVALTGSASTVTAGVLVGEAAQAVTGEAAVASAGSIVVTTALVLDGSEVASSAGTLSVTIGNDVVVALTGSEVLASAGTLEGYTNLGLTGIEVGLFAGSVEPDAVVGHSVHSTGGGGGGGSRLWSRDLDEEIEEEMGAILRGPVLTPEVIEAVAVRLDSPPEIRIIERRPPPGPRYAVPTLDFAATQARKRKNRQRLLLLL